ncbi:MAG TPA: PASTA domain-containing protein [Flavobacteriaceae bacterium]|nr:PASTA domain-containing protein [Flavobacteriaceae bacterium]
MNIALFKTKLFLKQMGLAILGSVLFIFLVFQWLKITTNHNQKIEVPNLQKMSLTQVEETLDELDLNYVVIDSTNYNPEFPRYSVLQQNPEVGEFVKEKRKIYITLNPSGFKDLELPDLYGHTKRQATTQLEALGFRVSKNDVQVSDIAKDVVRALVYNGKVVKKGNKIPKNSIITLVVGDGEGSTRYVRPE